MTLDIFCIKTTGIYFPGSYHQSFISSSNWELSGEVCSPPTQIWTKVPPSGSHRPLVWFTCSFKWQDRGYVGLNGTLEGIVERGGGRADTMGICTWEPVEPRQKISLLRSRSQQTPTFKWESGDRLYSPPVISTPAGLGCAQH